MNNSNKLHNCTDIVDIRFLFQLNVGYRKLRHFQVLCNVHYISSRVTWIPSVVHICSLIPICLDEKQKIHSSSTQGFQSHKTKELTLIFSARLLSPTPIHSRKREHEPLSHPPPPKKCRRMVFNTQEKLQKMGTQFGGVKNTPCCRPKIVQKDC